MSANIPNDPVAIQRFFTSRDNNANAATYVGQEQRLWYDPITNAIYVSDGNTAGGILVGGGGSGNGVPGGPTNSIQYNAGNGTFGGTSNLTISGNGISVTGNVTTATFFIGDGSQLTNLPIGNYSNANVANFLPTYSGNISGGNIGVSGAINAVGEITSFANIVVSSGGYFQGDGSQLTNLPVQPGTYGNANVANYLPTNTTIININSNVANTNGNVANLTTALGNTNSNVANLTLVVANNSANITALQNQVYSNANVAAYLPTYSGNISAGNISTTGDVVASNGNTVIDSGVSTTGNVTGANIVTVGNVTANNFLGNSYLYANGASIFANIQLTGNIDLGNLYIIDETIYGKNTNQDIVLSPDGTGYVSVPKLAVAVGSLIQGTAQVNPIIASLVLNQVIANSTGPGNTLPAGSYGNPEGVTAPWAVYQFTTVPSPVLDVNDVIAGTGVPVPSVVQWVGNTSGTDPANANVVVTSGSYSSLPTPIPSYGNIITVTRALTLAGLDIVSAANTTINLLPGTAGNVIIGSSMLPLVNNAFDLGSPTARWRSIYFGGATIYVYDPVLGVDQSIAAYNGNLVVGGGTGLSVGEFTFFGNTIAIANPTEDIYFGTNIATGNINFRRPLQVLSNVAYAQPTFQVDRNGLTTINVSSTLPNTVAALNVNGATSGNSYPRNFSATLVQLTGLDNEPARLSADAFGANTSTGQNAYFAIAGRAARGNVDSPGQTLANDTLTRITSQAFNNAGAFQGSIVRYNQMATGNVTTTSAGTRHNFQATPTGSVVIKNIANIDAVGLTLTSFANSGPANTGITFQDGSFQSTAYIPSNTVTSITAATGIDVTAATGNITITNTGVITAQGTANQIAVNGSYANTASGNIILTLPQDISASSNPTFNNITAGNINVLGNLTYSNVDTIDSYRLYLANTSTISSQINGGGIILGNVADGTYWRSILYDQTTDAWSVQGTYGAGNLIAGNVYSQSSNVASQVVRNDLHIGQANEILDYPNALLQADTDTLGYAQIVFQNHGNSGNSSTDYVAVNNIGNDTQNYIDFGINSSTYANTDYAVTGANDGYLYVNGGNLAIGTQSPANVINFFTGGTNAATNIRAVVDDTGLSMKNANVLVQDGSDNEIIELRTDGNIVFNGSQTLRVNSGFYVSSVNTNAGDANIVNYVGGQFVYGPALKDYAGNLRANNISAIGSVTAAGNITGAYIVGNGSALTGVIHALGNTFGIVSANGVSLVANTSATTLTLNPGNNIVITGTALTNTAVVAVADAPTFTGNVTANYFVGNGSRLTSLTGANVVGSVAQANYANTANSVAGSNVSGQVANALVAGTVYTAAQPNITTVGTLTVVNTSGNISATGNITAAYHIGNGSLLTSLTGANVTGTVANAAYALNANVSTFAGTVTTAAQPNITSVGTLTSLTSNGVVNFANTSNVALGAVASVHITGGSANNVLITNGSGNLSFASLNSINGVGGNQLVYVLNAQQTIGSAKNTLLSLFGLTNGVTLASNTRYQYEILFNSQCSKAGTLSYALALSGGAVVAQHNYNVISNKTTTIDNYTAGITMMSQNATGNAITTAQTVADTATFNHTIIQGTIDVTTGGNVNFMVSQDQNTPVTWTVNAGSYVKLLPLGAVGSNTVDGTWS
jgi:hypothetical protein